MPRPIERLARRALRAHLAHAPAAGARRRPLLTAEEAGSGDTGTDQEQVTQWLTLLHLLQGVPFNYLVPDAAMLPAESIRFFQVDDDWIEALLDGAWSLGFAGVAQGTAAGARGAFFAAAAARARAGHTRRALLARARPRTAFTLAPRPDAAPQGGAPEALSGFLLRSAVVAGWPGMEVAGFADLAGTQPLTLVRLEAVAPSLLLCLFAGVVARVDLQEPAEAVHFGVDPDPAGGWRKALRFADGGSVGQYTGASVAVPLRGGTPPAAGAPVVIDLDALARDMSGRVWASSTPDPAAFTAAQFALEMVEGMETVSFRLTPT